MDHSLAYRAASPPEPAGAAPGDRLPVGLHPMFGTTAIGGAALSIIPSWIAVLVKGTLEELVILTIITIVTNIPAAGFIWLIWRRYARSAGRPADRFIRRPRDFHDFLDSEMEIGTGRIKGRDAYWFAVAMGLACAVLGIGTGIGIGIS